MHLHKQKQSATQKNVIIVAEFNTVWHKMYM